MPGRLCCNLSFPIRMYLSRRRSLFFGVVQWVITKSREGEKTILHIETKDWKTSRGRLMCLCVLCCGEKNRMLCHYGKRSLGHEQKSRRESKCNEKKRVKTLRGKRPGREEAWKRIIAKYISSIRDAFLGLNFNGAIWWAYEKLATSNGKYRRSFSLRLFGSFLRIRMSLWRPTEPLLRNEPGPGKASFKILCDAYLIARKQGFLV